MKLVTNQEVFRIFAGRHPHKSTQSIAILINCFYFFEKILANEELSENAGQNIFMDLKWILYNRYFAYQRGQTV